MKSKPKYVEHIKIEKTNDISLRLSIYGDAHNLTNMLYNAMKSNQYFADIVMETVLFYNCQENSNVNLN
jgi:hypothetical protein